MCPGICLRSHFQTRWAVLTEVPTLSQSKRFKDCPQCLEVLHKILNEFYAWQMLRLEAIVCSWMRSKALNVLLSEAAWLHWLPSSSVNHYSSLRSKESGISGKPEVVWQASAWARATSLPLQLSTDLCESGCRHPVFSRLLVFMFALGWLSLMHCLLAWLFPCFGRLSKMCTQYLRKGIA